MQLDRVFVDVTGEQLRSLLLAIGLRLTEFTQDEIEDLCTSVAALESDDDVLIEPAVFFHGEELPFVVDVFKDSQGALEVMFIVAPSLTHVVQEEASAIGGPTAVRRLLAKQSTEAEE